MSRILRVALTGPSGSGKSTFSRMLKDRGIEVIDCDKVVRMIETPGHKCFDEIVSAFGSDILREDGELDRRALAAKAFADDEHKRLLNTITHKYVLEHLERHIRELEQDGKDICVIEAGALIESGLHRKVDEVILVTAPREELCKRIMERDSISMEQALQRLDAQTDAEELRRISGFEFINDGELASMERFADETINKLKEIYLKGTKMAEKSEGVLLSEKLLAKDTSTYKSFSKEVQSELGDYCGKYMDFMNRSKTEREFTRNSAALLEENGFEKLDPDKTYKAGDKVYWNNKKKSLVAAVIGTESLDKGVLITAAHIDSPRLDLKPRPLYEDTGLAYFKTHYYGGIKKYQWVALPLSLHGTIVRKDGTELDLCLGEDDDHVFYISDLLPHLSRKAQGSRTMGEVITGEELNIILGSEPYDDKDVKDPIKLNVLKYLNDKYGLVEDDFLSAEIEMVPALKAKYIGFDNSLIGAYGHDDKVCGYTALTALIDTPAPAHTCICVLADKEEIGSVGNTGLNSDMLRNFITMLCRPHGIAPERVFISSKCLSADVNAAFDPDFPQVCDRLNNAYLNHGPVISKYTGSGGKGGSNDASAEFMGEIRRCLDDAGIPWQVGELGKVDEGGGGTVAQYVAHLGIDTADIGVALLSMHSPFELASSYDVLATNKAIKAFYSIK